MARRSKKIDFTAIAKRVGGIGAGVVGASYVYENIIPAEMDEKIKPLIIIGAGVMLPELLGKDVLIESIGDGMIGKGVQEAVKVYAPELAENVGITDPVMTPAVTGLGVNPEHVVGMLPNHYNPLNELLYDEETGRYYRQENGQLVPLEEDISGLGVEAEHILS